MKTYDDLTDNQLLELAALAHDQPGCKMLWVDRGIAFNRIVEGENGVKVFFHTEDGTIIRTRNNKIEALYNPFKIVDKCREWGVNYV